MQDPAVAVRNNEWIPIRQIDLIHIIAIGMFFDLGRDVDAEAHGERHLCTGRKCLRQSGR